MSKWTDDRVNLLKELWGEGKTAKEIAQLLGGGLTRNAVIGKAHRMKLSGRVSPIQQNKTVAQEKKEASARKSGKLKDIRTPIVPAAKKPVPAAKVATPKKDTETGGKTFVTRRRPTPPEANEAQGAGVELAEIKEKMCRWPIGDPKEDDFHFCGGRVTSSLPYCDVHAQIAYNVNIRSRSINVKESDGKNRRDEADELLSSMANSS
ncbi:MAG: gcrA cell cycle regulator family protein [Alphaproteobacteria bacterium]|nr:gcrA cell cycle regulator family protein [Alphaproteobacteria bacterium]|tara:strand:+ start:120 stop:740 length:621 start_codon:yes stop_codon:yes gene_type:complete